MKRLFPSRQSLLLSSDDLQIDQAPNATYNGTPSGEPSSGALPSQSFPAGVKTWHECADAQVDICFVHGLKGHRDKTWTAAEQDEPWPKALLPDRIDKARILTYGYDADVSRLSVASVNNMSDHAENFLNDLTTNRARSNAASRPLIFVAHSLGGLVCKEAILLSRNNPEKHLRHIFDCAKGIVFMGTPHKGSWMAYYANISAATLGAVKSTNKALTRVLKKDDEYLNSVHKRFTSMIREQKEAGRGLEISCFYEELPLIGVGVVVSKDSATFDGYSKFSIHANHSDMVKFWSADDNDFTKLLGELERWQAEITNPAMGQPEQGARDAQPEKLGTGDQFTAPGATKMVNMGDGHHWSGNIQTVNIRSTAEPERRNILDDCCKSLAFPEMDDRSNDIVDDAADGTCEWLREHPKYTTWINEGGLLWIKGNPGSGKSTLLRHALSYSVPEVKPDDKPLILSFFFHGRGNELQKTPLGLFRSLLYQLRDIPDALSDVVEFFEKQCKTMGEPGEKWQWHPRHLRGFFKSSIPKVLRTRPLWLFIDALDECGEVAAAKLAEYLGSFIETPSSAELKQFRICFTCRQYPILALDTALELYVERENKTDIETYVQNNLSKVKGRLSPEDLDEISGLITNRANGIFLWARHVVDRILSLAKKGAGPERMKDEINLVPEGLNSLYNQLIETMVPESWKLVQWICFATRPLSLIEMRWALLVEAECQHRSLQECQKAGDYPSDDEMMKCRLNNISCGLVEVTQDTNVVQFIHQSVKDFFVSGALLTLARIAKSAEDQTSMNHLEGTVHCRLSRICIRYIHLNTLDIEARIVRDSNGLWSAFPLLHYAATSWAVHAKTSEQNEVSQVDILEYFNWPSMSLVQLWLRVINEDSKNLVSHPLEGTRMIHILARYGLVGPLQAMLLRGSQERAEIEKIDHDGRTPLSWAAKYGHEVIVKLLVDNGANVNSEDDPLSVAAKNGHEAIVKLLVDKGANVNSIRQPLLQAAAEGHEAIVRLLIDKGAVVNSNCKKRLSWSSLWNRLVKKEAIFKLLVDKGAIVNT